MPKSFDRWVGFLVVLVLLVYIGLFHDLRHDDAYITFRYGQQLATGNGLVFNQGERLMGSTAPGHVLLSALLYPVVGKWWLPSVMSSLGVLGWVLQSVALARMFRPSFGPRSLVVGGVILIGTAWSSRFVALETNIAAAFSLWAITCGRERRWMWAAALAALGGLMRPDAHLASVVVGIAAIRNLGWRVWKPTLLFLAISLPWVIFAWSYYGEVIPQSANAKTHFTSFKRYFRHLVRHPASLPPKVQGTWWSTIIAWPLAIYGSVVAIRRDPRLVTFVVYGMLHFTAYAYLRPVIPHRWHLYPLMVVFIVLVVVALLDLSERARNKAVRWIIYAAIAVIFAGGLWRTIYVSGHRNQRMNGSREKTYLKTAEYLNEHADPDDTVASIEVGTIAYYTDLRMHDWGHLITTKPKKYRRGRDVPYRWMIIDFGYRRLRPKHLRANHIERSGKFGVWIYDLEHPKPRKNRKKHRGKRRKNRRQDV